MSLYEILKSQNRAPAWSNLKVRSIETNTLTVTSPVAGSIKDFYVSGTGLDSNDGLTALTPVLTMTKAIEVASKYSASECVINVSGTVGIGTSPAPANTGFDKVLDFSTLSQNYQLITISGDRSDEVEFGPAVATASAAAPYNKWYNLTGLSGLTASAYTKGIVHKKDGASQDLYACAISNTTTQVALASNEGPSIALDGFELYNVGSSMLYDNSKYVLLSEVPVIFRDMAIQGPTSINNFMLSLIELQFYGCKFISQAQRGFILGEVYLYGCVIEAINNSDSIFRRDAVVDAQSVNFQKNYDNFNVASNWEDVHGVDCSINFSSCTATIFRMLIETDGAVHDVAPLILSDSSITLISGVVKLDSGNQPTVYSVGSTLYSREGLEVGKYTAGAQPAILCEDGCFLKINGDCHIDSEGTHGVQLQNSQMSVTPDSTATPSNLFESVSEHAVTANRNSKIILNQQATKNVYGFASAAKEAIALSDCSKLIVVPAYANGPDFSSPATFAMIKSTYGSKVVLGNASYVNSGAGNHTVLNGITATTVAASGCAQDIALVGTANTATAQFCHVIVKA